MKKNLIYLLIVALVAMNMLLLFKLTAADPGDIAERAAVDSARLATDKYLHTSMVLNAQLNNNTRLDGEQELIYIDNSSTKLKEIVSNGPKIIVRSTEVGCGVCIENEMKRIEKFAKIIGDSNIVVITTHSNVRKLNVFKQTNNVALKLYISPALGLPYEKASDKPFIFLLDANLMANNFFIPEVSEPELSQAFYTAIYKRYFRPANQNEATVLPTL